MRSSCARRTVLAAAAVTALLVVLLPSPGSPTPLAPQDARSVSMTATPIVPIVAAAANVTVAPAFVPGSTVTDLGPAPSAAEISVVVGLAPSAPTALAGFVAARYVPGTTTFHRFASVAELASDFGPSPTAVAAAEAYFQRFGLSTTVSPDHLLLTITGPSGRVGPAFGTSFEEYRAAGGRTFTSHPGPAVLPSIAPWTGVLGLANESSFLPALTPGTSAVPASRPEGACIGYASLLVPCQVWQAYNMTSLIGSGTNGSGERVAVVDPYTANEGQSALTSDLATFAVDNGFPVGEVNYLYPVPSTTDLNSTTLPGWNYEDALDLEWARASAPGATIDMTFSPNANVGLYEAIDWLVAHQAVNVISLSWGEPDVGVFNAFSTPCSSACNASTDGSYGILAPVLEFAAAEGISVVAASGDCGASDGTSGLSTNFPASDPDVTGVGGTNLTVDSDGNYISESAWSGNANGAKSPGCVNQGGSGGGYSPFPRPAWQTDLPTGTLGRGVPDVALDAETAVTIVENGNLVAVSGTSVSTPIWAGIAALADQSAGHALGLLNPGLYAVAAGPDYSKDFHDIVYGNNGYSAGVGWDPVTGLGTPRVASLLPDLAAAPAVSTSNLASFVYASPRFGAAPLTVTFRVNATGGTGTYPLEGVSFGDGNASFAPGGSTHYTFRLPGVYSVQAYVADSDSNYSVSPPVVVVVGGGGTLSVMLSASVHQPGVGADVLFSATVAGGRAPYLLDYSFGDGTFLAASSLASVNHVYGARGSFCAAVVVADSAIPANGASSARVAVGVGGAAVPDCRNDTLPLVVQPGPAPGVRDAPADFPDLLAGATVTGGSADQSGLSPSLQFSLNDPYASACGCSILRSPGTYNLTFYANDSESQQAQTTVPLTVAPPLVGRFSVNRTFGVAPLGVEFHASAEGGYGANASLTDWTFGDGTGATGADLQKTYSAPGEYLATAHLSDRGHGNASEAFLIDVEPSGASSLPYPPYLTATVFPAVDVPLGASVNFTARLTNANGSAVPSTLNWSFGNGSGAYRAAFNWTYSSPGSLMSNGSLAVHLTATFLWAGVVIGGVPAQLPLALTLPDFAAVEPGGFAPRVDALSLSDHGGPALGIAPLAWNGTASISGPGSAEVAWRFANGTELLGAEVTTHLSAGTQTIVVTGQDAWGDVATDVLSVWVVAPLAVSITISSASGASTDTVDFASDVTGGFGPMFQFFWSFGDGTTSAEPSGTHTFPRTGVFPVRLTVTDQRGYVASAETNVTIGAPPASFPVFVLITAGAAVGVVAAVLAVGRRSASRRDSVSP